MDNKKQKNHFSFSVAVFLGLLFAMLPNGTFAANIGEVTNFNVASNFEATGKSQVQAVLIKTASQLNFYVEKSWWETQVPAKQTEIFSNLDTLSTEFNGKIYPTLTSVFGQEAKPGVDGDSKITVLFHSLREGVAGYFRSADGYLKLQVPESNEREMVYLSLVNIENPQLKVFLAHEFTHLIGFNQKDKVRGVFEETWLNEARADYSSTILGYDNTYEGSNLQRRVRDFLASPADPLTEWKDSKYDYAVVNLFMHYLEDHYSISILADSLKSKSIGISSLNEVLAKNGENETFSQIFTNWTITTLVNDCSINLKYCYLNKNLKNLRISPTLNFLPVSGNSSLSVTNVIKNWAGNWQKIIGGNGDLKLEFSSLAGLDFKVPYLVFDKDNHYTITFLSLDKNQKGVITIKDFGSKYNSLVIIPSLQAKIAGFDGPEFTYPYSFSISISGAVSDEDQELIQKLLAQIEELKKQIADLQVVHNGQGSTCPAIVNNLYIGLQNKAEVSCLQQFLKNQGGGIYPEGLVTGNFGSLTRAAVIRFQKYYGIITTGYVGILTRTKINELLP